MMQPSAMAARSNWPRTILLAGQIAGMGVDRRLRVEEIELGDFVDQVEIGVEEGLDRSDVLPIALVDVGEKTSGADQVRE